MSCFYMGMDIGGTNTRIKLKKDSGEEITHTDDGCTLSTCGKEAARRCYQKAVLSVIEDQAAEIGNCQGICVAASGIDSEELEEECRDIFVEMGFPREKIWVYNDCEIMLKDVNQSAVILTAGTGSIAYGNDITTGKTVRSGGWGHILSDEGSAMYLGMQALKAAGNHMDRRRSCSILCRMIQEETGIQTLSDLDQYINKYILEKPKIAGLAKVVETAALEGDQCAKDILGDCVEKLWDLAEDTCRKIEDEEGKTEILLLWGSVLVKNHIVRQGIIQKAYERRPDMKVQLPSKSALDIALEVAYKNSYSR